MIHRVSQSLKKLVLSICKSISFRLKWCCGTEAALQGLLQPNNPIHKTKQNPNSGFALYLFYHLVSIHRSPINGIYCESETKSGAVTMISKFARNIYIWYHCDSPRLSFWAKIHNLGFQKFLPVSAPASCDGWSWLASVTLLQTGRCQRKKVGGREES